MPAAVAETRFLDLLPEKDGRRLMPLSHLAVDRKLTDSASAEIFLAQHVSLEMPMLLRVVRSERSARLRNHAALLRAIRQTAKVRHHNVVGIYDLGEYQGRSYMVLPYHEGVPMTERMKARPYTEHEALGVLMPIADAVSVYWKMNLIHRGISPRRINLTGDGTPMLDLVIYPNEGPEPELKASHAPHMAGFWAPEEINDGPVDPRSDMFSLGATLFYAVTGQTPFGMGSHEDLLERGAKDEPLDPHELAPKLHADVRAFIQRCLRRDPHQRFGSIAAFQAALRELQYRMLEAALPRATAVLSSGFHPAVQHETRIESGGTIGPSKLLKKVGSGAFGVVWRARHKALDIDVAVKLLPMEIAQKDPTFVKMFLREARTAARIRHPHVIGIFEAGEQNGQYYLIMEYAGGGTVLDRMNRYGGKLPVEVAVPILLAAGRGLGAAAKLNIVHRDIKPENLMFGAGEVLKIADLGLAKRLPNAGPSIAASIRENLITGVNPSTVVGTPAYMAPEAAMDPDRVDPRTDLYSLGITAWQMLAGALPLEGKATMETIIRHVNEDAPPLRDFEPGVSEELSRIVAKLLKRDPAERFQSGDELAEALLGLRQ